MLGNHCKEKSYRHHVNPLAKIDGTTGLSTTTEENETCAMPFSNELLTNAGAMDADSTIKKAKLPQRWPSLAAQPQAQGFAFGRE